MHQTNTFVGFVGLPKLAENPVWIPIAGIIDSFAKKIERISRIVLYVRAAEPVRGCLVYAAPGDHAQMSHRALAVQIAAT